MAISLNADLVHALIEERFGSIADLAVEWEERVASGIQRVGRPRNRASIYRWLKSGLPSHRDDVLGFAAALDVDPVALLDIDRPDAFPARLFRIIENRVLDVEN